MTYNMKIIYRDIKFDEIQIIKDIWEKNRDFHINISSFFNFLYEKLVFEDRMKPFENMNQDNLKITIAQQNDIVIGYCLSTIAFYEGFGFRKNTIEMRRRV